MIDFPEGPWYILEHNTLIYLHNIILILFTSLVFEKEKDTAIFDPLKEKLMD